MKIELTHHARKRLREQRLTIDDVRNVLKSRGGQSYPSKKKRVQGGRALSGEKVNVVYTEEKAGEFRIVSVVTPDRR